MRDLSVPDFHRQVLAVNRVERLLKKVTAALDAVPLPYAVIGGNAVAAWVATVDEGAVRATKDVDLLVRRPDHVRIAAALRPLGLVPMEVLGVVMFVDRRRPNPKTGVHVVFGGERIRPHYETPAPDPQYVVRSAGGFAVLDLPRLVTMKLQAWRDIDRVHLRDLRDVGLLTEALLAQTPRELASRLNELTE